MIIRTGPRELAAAVGSVMGVVPSKPIDPILAGVVITPYDGGFTLSAYDYDSSAVVRVDSEIEAPDTVVVSGRGLHTITKVLPVSRPVEITVEGGGRKLVITSGATTFTLPTLDAGQFPALPTVNVRQGSVDIGYLATMARKVAHAANQDADSARLSAKGAVLVRAVSGGELLLTAGTGYQLATGSIEWIGQSGLAAQIPAAGLLDILAALPTAGTVDIYTNEAGSVVGFRDEQSGVITTTSTVDHNFPTAQIERMFNRDDCAAVRVESAGILGALRRTKAVMGKYASPFITLEFGDDTGEITVEDTVHDEFDVTTDDSVIFGVDIAKIIETISTFDSDMVDLHFPNQHLPNQHRVIVSDPDDAAYSAVVAGGGSAK